jgi:hypothetical protein
LSGPASAGAGAGGEDAAPPFVGGAGALGLRPRPTVDPVVAALVAQAVLELWPRAGVDTGEEAARAIRAEAAARAWRFSGRWWTRSAPLRRGRPWVR